MVGAGGLGAAAGLVLARSGVGHITVLDDDRVDVSNLHRQLLFDGAAVGHHKAPLAATRLQDEAKAHGHTTTTACVIERALPDTVCDLLTGHDLVIEGADNYATKFMTADAARLLGLPVVHAGAVRWVGWAKATAGKTGRTGKTVKTGTTSDAPGPCLRCIFEDIPRGQPDTCASAGVVGPVVGVLGAIQAALALRLLGGEPGAAHELWNYRALAGTLRRRSIGANPNCPLCAGEIASMDPERYAPPDCAA